MPISSREYTTHDFSAVNSYVDHLAEKNRSSIREIRARNFGAYAKWGAVALVGAGITAALVMWGISFLKDYEIVEREIVVKEPAAFKPTIIVNIPGLGSESQEMRNAAENKIKEIKDKLPQGEQETNAEVVLNYNLFKEISFNVAGIEEVVVGMKFEDSNAKKPSHQWCYIMARNADGTKTWVDLANKVDSETFMMPMSEGVTAKIGLSQSDFERAQGLCSFE